MQSFIFLLEKFKKLIDYFIASFSIVAMFLLVCCVVWQVFSRLILKAPSTYTDELARFSMIWTGLLGAAYTFGIHRHLCVDLMTMHFKGIKKLISDLIINVSVIVFCSLVMLRGGWILLSKVHETQQLSSAMEIPMSYVYLALPISGIIIVFYGIIFCIFAISNYQRGDNNA